MLSALPLKVIVASAMPSPTLKVRPVVWLSVNVPLVSVSVSVSGSDEPLLWIESRWLAAFAKVSSWVSATTCLPGLARLRIGVPVRMLLRVKSALTMVPSERKTICRVLPTVAAVLTAMALPAVPLPITVVVSKLLINDSVFVDKPA